MYLSLPIKKINQYVKPPVLTRKLRQWTKWNKLNTWSLKYWDHCCTKKSFQENYVSLNSVKTVYIKWKARSVASTKDYKKYICWIHVHSANSVQFVHWIKKRSEGNQWTKQKDPTLSYCRIIVEKKKKSYCRFFLLKSIHVTGRKVLEVTM